MRIDRRLLGWGALLVIAGVIPLAIRAGVLQRDLVEGWPALWPLLLIGGGLGLILRGTPVRLLGGTISVVTAGVMLGGLISTGFGGFPSFGACGTGSSATPFADRTGTLADAGSIGIEFNCGALNVTTGDGSGWSLTGRANADRQPEVTQNGGDVQMKSPRNVGFVFGDTGSTWNVVVPRTPHVQLSVTLNAGDASLDLTGATLGGTSITVNAGSLKADLGSVVTASDLSATVNAGSATIGLPGSLESANLSLNAGSMTVCVPAQANLRVSWSGGLASNNFDAAGLTKVGDNEWQMNGPAANRTDLHVSANAGSFTLLLGGSCHA